MDHVENRRRAFLEKRNVDLLLAECIQALISDRTDHADDFAPLSRAEPEALADRILTRPESARRFFVHNGDGPGVTSIVRAETAPLDERDAHSAEVSRRNVAVFAGESGAARRQNKTLNVNRSRVEGSINRKGLDRTRRRYARQAAQPFEDLVVKRHALEPLRIPRGRQRDAKRQALRHLVSGPNLKQMLGAAEE